MHKLAVYIVPYAIGDKDYVVREVHRSGRDKHRDEHQEYEIEDEFLGWRKHIEGERDFILVLLKLEPADEGGNVGRLLSGKRFRGYGWHGCERGVGWKAGDVATGLSEGRVRGSERWPNE